ncbi:MAG: hypothetical protein EA350_12630 [Gemmatimonadales bacterium]|nr:MAG: hypothetical protein EA350_12630 [Gemmatimonadales bacterium]
MHRILSGGGVLFPLLAMVLVLGAGISGCSWRNKAPPEAGYERGGVPNLRGERVLLLPPQLVRGAHADLERELVYALEGRGGPVEWIGPDAIRRRVASTPGMRFDPDGLPVQRFLSGELQRVGDPLFGALYRLAAVEDAAYAVIPVMARDREEDDGSHVVELGVALIHTRTGRVYWYGIVEGDAGPAGALPATVSAVEALARRLLR